MKLIMLPRNVKDRGDRVRAAKRKSKLNRSPREHINNKDRPFIFWDGEGPHDAGYALFGNSMGYEICHPFLSSVECLDLLLSCGADHPNAIHIGFGFNYDVSMILHNLPWRCLNALKTYNGCQWGNYELEHIPGKWFTVRRDNVKVQVFDIHSFFQCSYVTALQEHGIGEPTDIAAIAADKARRSEFLWRDIDDIRRYWLLELKYGPALAETLRQSFLAAGYDITSWHGPGALARAAIRRHNVHDAMAVSPVDVQIAARYAFAGGRFEMFRGGHVKGKVYNADIRSAYPANAAVLPNLSKGRWRRTRDYEPDRFGVYRIHYYSREKDPLYVHPIFCREHTGTVSWPKHTFGWYWNPEAALVANNSEAEIQEGWVFDETDPTDRPFAWIEEYYRRRAFLKRQGNPMQLTYKLVINSVYGQLAQRSGWDRKHNRPPSSHQLEWAGYITSACRARVYSAAVACGDNLISIDTDGIYSMAPIPVQEGAGLGDWEKTEYDGGIFWQSGIYALQNGPDWVKGRTRGIPKGSYSPVDLLHALDRKDPLRLTVGTFVGYGLALNGQYERMNTWIQEPHEILFGGQGKRYHNEPFYCARGKCPGNGIHHFIPPPEIGSDYRSQPHYLPWLSNSHSMEYVKNLLSDLEAYDANELDEMDYVA